MRDTCIIALLFFSVCMGLGFPSLERYDPRSVAGLNDTRSYAAMVDGDKGIQPVYQLRILVPALARPIARVARGRTGGWSPRFFGLLVVNGVFISLAATLLMQLTEWVSGRSVTGLVAALLYLLTFNVSAYYLQGLVDSVEACALIVAAWLILSNRLNLIPFVGFVAALGKETTIPLLLAFCLVWLYLARARLRIPLAVAIAISLVLAQISAVMLARWLVDLPFTLPWRGTALANLAFVESNARVETLFNREWIYSFLWLIPLGLPRLRRVPKEWISASLASFAIAMFLGLLLGVRGNVVRPSFNALAPIFIVASAIYLVDLAGHKNKVSADKI